MTNCYAATSTNCFAPDPNENVMESIFKQYERVIITSLITSFGLDSFVKDQHGGDVDTIHNVRQIGKDGKMGYKNQKNQTDYEKRGDYNSNEYHSDKRYKDKNREINEQKKAGNHYDAYTGNRTDPNGKTDLDHTKAAKEIHDDAGRVLAGINGVDLANANSNLNGTNPHTNRTKKANTMDDFLDKHEDEYTEKQKDVMHKKDATARKEYENRINTAYYTSPKFAKDVGLAAGKVGVNMGLRQAVGFVFAEMWFAAKEEFNNVGNKFDFGELLSAIGRGIKRGFENAKGKYKEIFDKFKEGALAGALSSVTTTLCNIFFTTAKNVVKIIRESYVSVVQATKVLFINPDNLAFGERMRAATKILATGASVVVGGLVSQAIGQTAIGVIPIIGDVVQTFCGALVTGVMSCTLLYFLDRSEIVNKLVRMLNSFNTIDVQVNYYRQQAEYFERFAAELMNIDIKKFKDETEMYSSLVHNIENVKDEVELNKLLIAALDRIGAKMPWTGDFDSFMSDKNAVLVFE